MKLQPKASHVTSWVDKPRFTVSKSDSIYNIIRGSYGKADKGTLANAYTIGGDDRC